VLFRSEQLIVTLLTMNLFGKKKAPEPLPQADVNYAIQNIDKNLEILEKREQNICKKIDLFVAEAKTKIGKKDKTGALFALKRKKMAEAEIQKIQGARLTLEKQKVAIESASLNLQVLNAMKHGAATVKKIHGDLDGDKVEEIMEDIEEQTDIQNAISEAISKPYGELNDDEDLLKELEELEELETEVNLLNNRAPTINTSTAYPSLPNAPTGAVPIPGNSKSAAEADEEEILRELERQMA